MKILLWWIKFLRRCSYLGNIEDVFLHSYIIDISSTMDVLLMDVSSNTSVTCIVITMENGLECFTFLIW